MAENAAWVKACNPPVIPGTGIHAMAMTPMVLWTVWWSWANFALLVLVVVLFAALEIKGRRPRWLIARQRSRLRGQRVQARPYWYRRRRSRIESYATLKPALAWDAGTGPKTAASAGRKATPTSLNSKERR